MMYIPTALFFNGVQTGCLLFVSFVDARLLRTLCDKKKDDAIKTIFSIWWPAGRDLMVPLSVATMVADAAAYWSTKQMKWAIAGSLVFSTLVWTGVIMGESIQALRDTKSSNDTFKIAKNFCFLHQFRLVAAVVGFSLVLFY